MKNFPKFLREATAATVQARRLGLVGDGHGGWYNRGTGEFEAKTFGGQLQYFNKRQVVGRRDPRQTPREKMIASPSYNDPQLTQQPMPTAQQPTAQDMAATEMPPDPANMAQEPMGQVSPDQQAVPQEVPQELPPQNFLPVEKTKGVLTIAFGRFNPPTIGHQQLMDTAAQAAMQEGGDYIIVPSRTNDPKKNPLDPDSKISFMRRMFPDHSERIVNDPNYITIFDVLKKAHNDGYAGVRIVGGADRVKEFEKLANNYNGQLYQFDAIEVISSGDRDPDSNKGVEGVSASRLRLAAAEGDFITFREGLPPGIKNKEALELFYLVRQGMGIQEIQQEGYNTWEIAPKFDVENLRENYIEENIFKIGDIVENLNTGLTGKIIRRGTNYLICVTENGMMFKSWIKDVSESMKYSEVRMSRRMRLPGKPNTLVGTDGYRENAMAVMKVTNIKNFINKNKKK